MEQHLIVSVNFVNFGLKIDQVISIERMANLTDWPLMPDYVSGMVSIRGKILPVLDMKYILYGKKANVVDASRLVLIENAGDHFALLVDEAREIISLAPGEIKSLNSLQAQENSIFDGAYNSEQGLVSLINIDRFLEILSNINLVREQAAHQNNL